MKISDKEILNKKPANLRSLKWGGNFRCYARQRIW